MITLSNINIIFNRGTPMERVALNQINLDIHPGDFVTVIGTNGAGKSTLLHSIAGELLPSQGSIYINEENVTHRTPYQRAHLVARVFQDPLIGTCGGLTIAENLALASQRGSRRTLSLSVTSNLRKNFQETLCDLNLGLQDRLDTLMEHLSGGQRQAVSLLMATLSPLKILLLDEHTSALDPKTADFILNLTKKIVREKQLTALMVTHSLDHALDAGNRTLIMHEGRLMKDLPESERAKLTANDLFQSLGSKAV